MTCPSCGGECERDTVDVGVGEHPTGPWGCPSCHWVEAAICPICFAEAPGGTCHECQVASEEAGWQDEDEEDGGSGRKPGQVR